MKRRHVRGLEAIARASGVAIGVGLVLVSTCKPTKAPKPFEPCVEAQASSTEAEGVVASLGPKLRACYEEARKSEPLLQGCLVIHAKVDAGKVEASHVETLHGLDAELAECAQSIVSQATFAPSTKGIVSVPFTVTAGK